MCELKDYTNKTISQIEGIHYPIPNREEVSYLVWRVNTLREKRISEFTIEDLRILIGQNIALKYLIPISLKKLEENPFCSGDFYEGDLLETVLGIEGKFWEESREMKILLYNIIRNCLSDLEKLDVTDEIKNDLYHKIEGFL